ncbi:BtrH N-terminal domain-containing protein [Virgibacillus proomii]|uniref:BtrH N-terminal domain-containing protein n=1 Tax=Virgibacillus proomii TaxID=84407 RepID=UPI001C10B312|nr:BtrH N-terminal domain-containing protein [Virgibacillus proomii]MBU5265920.1 BtrH N-terminal domain-containing protein [Virgibacillus proomii]
MNSVMINQKTTGLDCANLAINSLLDYKGYKYYSTLWKQCGLMYIKTKGDSFGQIKGNYMKMEEEFWLVNGVTVKTCRQENPNLLSKEICDFLKKDEPIIVYVDVFELPYNKYYKKMHGSHCVTIIDQQDKSFTIIDNVFRYTGQLSFEHLLNALNISLTENSTTSLEYTYFSLLNAKIPKKEEMFEVVNKNNRFLRGNINKEEYERIKLDNKINEIEVGLNSINLLMESLKKNMGIRESKEKEWYKIHRDLSNIANLHYSYSYFLEYLAKDVPDFEKIQKRYYNLAKNWNMASNLALKASINFQESLLDRLIKKLTLIRQKEEDVIENSEDLYQKNITLL